MAKSQVLRSEDTCESSIRACQRGHLLTPDNQQRIGKAGIRCRICRQRIAREYERRKSGFYIRNLGAQVSA